MLPPAQNILKCLRIAWIAYVFPIPALKLIKLIDEFKITYPFLCYDYNSHYYVIL